jgi:hypothetical protein
MKMKFKVGDWVLANHQAGIVIQYRKNEEKNRKTGEVKIVGDGRTTVAFIEASGENVKVVRQALSEEDVELLDLNSIKALKDRIAELEKINAGLENEVSNLEKVS